MGVKEIFISVVVIGREIPSQRQGRVIDMFSKIFSFVKIHKIITAFLLLIIIGGSYLAYQKLSNNDSSINYATAAVEKGALIVSVSGSGQISASDQIDIKSKASGDIVGVYTTKGQEVGTGTLLVQIDTKDAQKAVQDAEISLETAQVQLEDLLEPPDELTVLQAENSLAKANQSKQKAEDNIVEGYEDAFNAITDAFFDLPTIISDMGDILYSYEIGDSEKNLSNYWNTAALLNSINIDDRYELERLIRAAEDDYETAREKYDENLKNYKDTSRYSEYDVIEALLEETIDTLRAMSESIKSEVNMIDFWVDYRSRRNLNIFTTVTDYQSNLKSYTSKTNSLLSNLLSIQRSFEDNRQAVLDAEYSIKEKELSLEELMAGPDDLEVRSKKITVQQKEDALLTAKQNLADCFVRAPSDGIVAEVYVKKGDSGSSGTKLLTFISKQKLAEITLNEIDIANVKIGQKATIVFDAIEDLTLTGEVVEVDTLGTATQGVVTYSVKIAFDTEEDRIKPGMSVTADIITDARQDVLLLPNSALKSQQDTYYVELVKVDNDELRQQLLAGVSGVVLPEAPELQPVEIGFSNDLYTEIISGLEEGDIVITSTTSSSGTQSSQTQRTQGFMPGMEGGEGVFRANF